MAADGQGRQAIGHDEGHVMRPCLGIAATGQQRFARWRVQPPPQIRPLQVDAAIGSRTVQAQAAVAQCLQGGVQRLGIQCQVHGITGLRMRQLKGQLRRRGLAHPGTAQRDAGVGEPLQQHPRIGDDLGCVVWHRAQAPNKAA